MIASSSSVPLPIEFLSADSEGTIVELSGNPSYLHRLEEMGIRNGVRIKMVQSGEPCLIAIEGRRVSLRLGSSAEVYVQPAAG